MSDVFPFYRSLLTMWTRLNNVFATWLVLRLQLFFFDKFRFFLCFSAICGIVIAKAIISFGLSSFVFVCMCVCRIIYSVVCVCALFFYFSNYTYIKRLWVNFINRIKWKPVSNKIKHNLAWTWSMLFHTQYISIHPSIHRSIYLSCDAILYRLLAAQ